MRLLITSVLSLIAVGNFAEPLPLDTKSSQVISAMELNELCEAISAMPNDSSRNICVEWEKDKNGKRNACLEWGGKVNKLNFLAELRARNQTLDICESFKPDKREVCRQSRDMEKLIECIERGIYDPCDDAGGKWYRAMCMMAHSEIGERKIQRARKIILSLYDDWNIKPEDKAQFINAEKMWEDYRNKYCGSIAVLARSFIDRSEAAILAMQSSYGFCIRRLNEKHAEELKLTEDDLIK